MFFIDTSGALCSRSSGHAIDVESTLHSSFNRLGLTEFLDESLVLRHRRPVSHPFPNAYSHPLPRFSYDRGTKQITVTFAADPSYSSQVSDRTTALSTWKDKIYLLSSIPMRKPRTIIDDAAQLLSSAISVPFSIFGSAKPPSSTTPDNVFSSGDIDLREDEILEQDRSEEGEVDDSPEKLRRLRVIAIAKEEMNMSGEKARWRRQWDVIPLRASKNRTNV